MKWKLIQLSMLVVCSMSATEKKHNQHQDVEEKKQEKEVLCPPKEIKSVAIDADKLLSGDWNYLECTPSIFCDHLICFSQKFEKEEFLTYNMYTTAFNMSSHKHFRADGVGKPRPTEGRILYDGTDPRGDGDYYILGTDYEHYSLIFSCLRDIYGIIRPTAWVASRDMYLKPSVEATVKDLMKKNGLDPDKLHSITDNSCENYKEEYGE